MAGKPVQNGYYEEHPRVLVSLEDFTSRRGDMLLQNIYFVVLGFNLDMQAIARGVCHFPKPNHEQRKSPISRKFPIPYDGTPVKLRQRIYKSEFKTTYYTSEYKNSAEDFFFAWYTPLHQIQKERIHILQDGYALFYGIPKRQASIYLAAFDIGNSDPKAPFGTDCHGNPKVLKLKKSMKEAVKAFQQIHYDLSGIYNHDPKRLVQIEQREAWLYDNYEIVKNRFSLLIKSLEEKILKLNHEIRFTNVFTLKENDEWQEGGHQDWGDHRMAMTIKVEVSQ